MAEIFLSLYRAVTVTGFSPSKLRVVKIVWYVPKAILLGQFLVWFGCPTTLKHPDCRDWFAVHSNLQFIHSSAASTHLNCVISCDHNNIVCMLPYIHHAFEDIVLTYHNIQHDKNELNGHKKCSGKGKDTRWMCSAKKETSICGGW